MDLIRIFIDTAFSKMADRFLWGKGIGRPHLPDPVQNGMIIDETMFVDECRCHHPELSDDQIRMIYCLYRDEWAAPPNDFSISEPVSNLFNVLFRFSHEVLRLRNREPLVVFRHLFRWRELTLNIGEDTLVAAFLAYSNRNLPDPGSCIEGDIRRRLYFDGIDFCSWPTVLHNDNPYLDYIFRNNRLCDLHSHLYASTDNFTISWVSLMNKIDNREKAFESLGKAHDESRYRYVASIMYSYVVFACALRLNLWRTVNDSSTDSSVKLSEILDACDIYARRIQIEVETEKMATDYPDYIVCDKDSPMSVIAGERKFLYAVYKYILQNDDVEMSGNLYRYLLVKNKFRSFLIQVDTNRGFANFKRYQDLKIKFMMPEYQSRVGSLAIWEAMTLNYTDIFETRVAPFDNLGKLDDFRKECKKIDSGLDSASGSEWSLLIHFLKHPENFKETKKYGPAEYVRDGELRERIRHQSVVLRQVVKMSEWEEAERSCLSRIRGIDAASSEIGCRPEIFAQAFRFLKDAGFAATFHVGEDFYDIADGLRAIDEAISFLGLEAGDRLGHVIALGIDPDEFYKERHNNIALPVQWMLDNVVWLYFSSRKYNTVMEPSTEDFILTTFRDLVREIGYERQGDGNDSVGVPRVEITDYYKSMLLRGDAPGFHDGSADGNQWLINSAYRHYEKMQSEVLRDIRRWNRQANDLYSDYMNDRRIISNGKKIKSFKVPDGYRKLIRRMQDAMIRLVSKKQLGIECCPSSNYKIGYCKRFDRHPIFRFMPVRTDATHYHLAVTVNTDDLGVFSTSLPNEYSLLALALMKMKDSEGRHIYSTQEVYDWVERIVKNGEKFAFKRTSPGCPLTN